MNSKKIFLPIGSIVMLKDASKKMMITGYLASVDGETVFDYSGCLFPEGILSSKQMCLFNHDQIGKLYFTGYENDEQKNFKDNLNKVVNNIGVDKKNFEVLEEI